MSLPISGLRYSSNVSTLCLKKRSWRCTL